MDFVANLRSAWELHLRSERNGRPDGPRDYVYASRRRACVRAMALDLLHPDDEREPDSAAMERMKRGVERELAVVSRLMQIGPRCTPPYEVIEGQRRFELRDRDGSLLIVGKVDGRLQFRDGGTTHKPVIEVKSGRSFERVGCIEDLDRSPWTRHALDQLLAYLYAESEPWGFFIFEGPGLPVFLRVDLEDHLGRVERFLANARAAVDHRFGRGPMPPQTQDRSECRRCPHFGRTCDPGLDYGDGVVVIDDPELVELAKEREQHEAAAKMFGHADKRLKEALRGVERGILDDFLITGKWGKSTRYNVPNEVREQYKEIDPKGRFTLTIERVNGDE